MPSKIIDVEGIGPVTFVKRSGTKSLRLSIRHDNTVRVTMPSWAPYIAGVQFVKSKQEWVIASRQPVALLTSGQQIGKLHNLLLTAKDVTTISVRVKGPTIIVSYPRGILPTDTDVQAAARRGVDRVLKKEASSVLPNRLQKLATEYDYSFSTVTIKKLSGRWGSCTDKREITLNSYLMTLPWELIDYVLLHELAHTKVMAHGPRFWAEMSKTTPELSQKRALIKTYKPYV